LEQTTKEKALHMNWFLDLFYRADWIAIAISLLAIVVGFFGTALSSALAVSIALWLQRRDFHGRSLELAQQIESSRRDARDEWRRQLTSSAFLVIDQAASYGMVPYDPVVKLTMTLNEIDSLQIKFRLDAETGGHYVGAWFKRRALELIAPQPDALEREAYVQGVSATMRFEISEWALGQKSSEYFANK
jgi:hypothetical protein